jgi:hypothetical protein
MFGKVGDQRDPGGHAGMDKPVGGGHIGCDQGVQPLHRGHPGIGFQNVRL